jgi:hypothetical protein
MVMCDAVTTILVGTRGASSYDVLRQVSSKALVEKVSSGSKEPKKS